MAYIKLEDAINHIMNHTPVSCSADFFEGQMDCVGQLKSLPTADVAEVKHGHWNDNIVQLTTVAGVKEDFVLGYKCSLCGRTEMLKEPYCNCGAIMDVPDNGEKGETYEKSKM